MASHVITLRLRVSAKQYADAARQIRAGNLNANPLALALIKQGVYVLSGYTAKQITLMDIATGRHYSGTMPAVLAKDLASFRRGVRVLEDHAFDLLLESEGG
jgi:glycine/serine hydroxymethyltransferase